MMEDHYPKYSQKEVEDIERKAYQKGYDQALADNHILTGKAAKKFIENMNHNKPTEEHKKFIEDCVRLFEETRRED